MPATLDVRILPAGAKGARLGESPFWDRGDSIWWVDIDGRKLMRTRLSNRKTDCWPTPQVPGFVVLTGPDRPVVGMEDGIYAFSPAEGGFQRLLGLDGPGRRFNDATIDGTGRLWASTMPLDGASGPGELHVVTDDLSLRTVLGGLSTPNGLAADMDGARLFVSDSHPDVQTIWAAPCDFRSGEIGERSVFASLQSHAGRPDGAAIGDGSARYWIACVDGGEILGFSAQGTPQYTVPLPFPAPTKLAFLAGGVAVTAKSQGGYDGRLAIATDAASPLRGPAVPFWRPGGRSSNLQ